MTHSVSVAPFLVATTAMSLHRPAVATHSSSYAAVLAGQPRRPSLSSDLHPSGNGFDGSRLAHSGGGGGGVGSGGPQAAATRPATIPSYLAESAYGERFASKIFHPSTISALGLSSAKKPLQAIMGRSTKPPRTHRSGTSPRISCRAAGTRTTNRSLSSC